MKTSLCLLLTRYSLNHFNPPLIALLPTFFTLQRHSGFEVVHLHLQAFQGQVAFAGLALVGDEYNDDEEDEEASGSSDADDGSAAERAVGGDVDHARGKLNATHTCLTHTHNIELCCNDIYFTTLEMLL